jgi:hypothetical protein
MQVVGRILEPQSVFGNWFHVCRDVGMHGAPPGVGRWTPGDASTDADGRLETASVPRRRCGSRFHASTGAWASETWGSP